MKKRTFSASDDTISIIINKIPDIISIIIKKIPKGEWFYVALVSTDLYYLVLTLNEENKNFWPSIEYGVSSVERIGWVLNEFNPVPKWLGDFLSDETQDGLVCAIRNGNLRVLKYLCDIIDKNDGEGDVDDDMCLEEFCANFAVAFGKIEIVEWLVKKDANSEEWDGIDMYRSAATDPTLKGLEWVKETDYIGNVNKTFESAAECGNWEGLKWLLIHERYPSTSQTFEEAIKSGNLKMLNWMLEKNESRKEKGLQEPFRVNREESTYSKAVDAVMHQNADKSDNIEYVLCIFDWLWKKGFEMDCSEGWTTIVNVGEKGYLPIIEWIEEKQFDWWKLHATQYTAAMTYGFIKNGHVDCLEWLKDNNRLDQCFVEGAVTHYGIDARTKQWLEEACDLHLED